MRNPSRKNRIRLILILTVAVVALESALLLYEKTSCPQMIIEDFSDVYMENCRQTQNGTFVSTKPDGFFEIPGVPNNLRTVEVDVTGIRAESYETIPLQMYYNTGGGYRELDSHQIRTRTGVRYFTTEWGRHIHTLRFDLPYGEKQMMQIRRIVCNPPVWKKTAAVAGMLLLIGIAAIALTAGAWSTAASAAYGCFLLLLSAAGIWMIHKLPTAENLIAVPGLFLGLAILFGLFLHAAEYPGRKYPGRVFLAVLIVFTAASYFLLSSQIPFGDPPDERMRYDVVRFIANHGTLPRGDDPEILNPMWGFSYAFQPMLPYIIMGFTTRAIMHYTTDFPILLMAARTVSILCGVLTICLLHAILKRMTDGPIVLAAPLFAALFPGMICISTYVSTESFAILASAIVVYFWVRGIVDGWKTSSCIGLSFGMALCLLSYQNSYGFVLLSIPLFFLTIFQGERNGRARYAAKQTALVVCATFLMAGWWFIRNMILYVGDPLARTALNACQEANISPQVRDMLAATPQKLGVTLGAMVTDMRWGVRTWQSFVCGFSHSELRLWPVIYGVFQVFLIILAAGLLVALIAGIVWRIRERRAGFHGAVLYGTLLLSAVFPGAIALWYSYVSDFQPQGRYLMPGFVPFLILCATAADGFTSWMPETMQEGNTGRAVRSIPAVVLAVFACVMFYLIFVETVLPFYL